MQVPKKSERSLTFTFFLKRSVATKIENLVRAAICGKCPPKHIAITITTTIMIIIRCVLDQALFRGAYGLTT